MPNKKPAKHPLKSRSMIAAYIVIILGLLQFFGLIPQGAEVSMSDPNALVIIDNLGKGAGSDREGQAKGLGLGVLGYLMAKGRRGAKEGIGDLI